jgi:hypothetical protein
MEFVKDMKREPCHDCACETGEHHILGCDVERCTFCGGQMLSCGCDVKEDSREKWSGIAFEEARLLCEEKGLYSYFGPNGWTECDEHHPNASHDLNRAVALLMEGEILECNSCHFTTTDCMEIFDGGDSCIKCSTSIHGEHDGQSGVTP